MANRTRTADQDGGHALLGELNRAVDKAEQMLQETASDLSLDGEAARSKLVETLAGAKATYQDLQKRVVAGAKRTDAMIRENPYPSLGVAFGIGVLVGFLVTRKK